MNILINAYAVSPNHGSEPGVGWNWTIELAKFCNVHVITEAEFKNEIEGALKNLPQKDNIHFYFNDIGEKARKMCWNQGDYRFYYYYNRWQKKTYEIALQIIKNNKIDIIHQLNMIGYREPGYLWKIKGIPKVWGPVGGFGSIPISFLFQFKKTNAIKQIIKNIINEIQVYQPNVISAIENFDVIFAAYSEAKIKLQKFKSNKVILLNETGSKKSITIDRDFNEEKLKLIWVGKNDPRKALNLALETMNTLNHLPIELHVVGVREKDINQTFNNSSGNIIFHSWVTHQEVQEYLAQSHIFFFTSLNEGTPHVVLEALSKGLPVICHDACGQGDVVDETCGLKIKMKNPNYSIKAFSDAIVKLFNERTLLRKLSDSAYIKAQKYSWENRVNIALSQYEEFLKR